MKGNDRVNRLHRWWEPWWTLGFFAFLVNFPWEMLQAPLYSGLADAPHGQATALCTVATLGDVVITWVAYGIVGLGTRSKSWFDSPSAGRMAAFLASGLVITVGMEALNVYVLGRWSFGVAMPVVLGVSVSPLLQWVALPPLVIWLTRRHLR